MHAAAQPTAHVETPPGATRIFEDEANRPFVRRVLESVMRNRGYVTGVATLAVSAAYFLYLFGDTQAHHEALLSHGIKRRVSRLLDESVTDHSHYTFIDSLREYVKETGFNGASSVQEVKKMCQWLTANALYSPDAIPPLAKRCFGLLVKPQAWGL